MKRFVVYEETIESGGIPLVKTRREELKDSAIIVTPEELDAALSVGFRFWSRSRTKKGLLGYLFKTDNSIDA